MTTCGEEEPPPRVFPFRREEGACPSSRHSHLDATGRGHTLPVAFLFPFGRDEEGLTPPRRVSTQWGGYIPSLLCSRFNLNATRRGKPLLVALFPFLHGEEGYTPPRRVSIPIQTRWGGGLPLLVALSHFDTVRRGYTPPRRVSIPIRTRWGGGLPLLVALSHLDTARRGYTLLVVFPFQFGRDKGHARSPSCSCFDVTGRGVSWGMPLYYVSFLIYFRYTLDTLDYFK